MRREHYCDDNDIARPVGSLAQLYEPKLEWKIGRVADLFVGGDIFKDRSEYRGEHCLPPEDVYETEI